MEKNLKFLVKRIYEFIKIMDDIIQNKVYGQKAIDRYNVEAPAVQLSCFVGKGLYQECSLREAELALEEARELDDDFVLSDPEQAVMLIGWGYSEHEEINLISDEV